jgi:hypothetical protein
MKRWGLCGGRVFLFLNDPAGWAGLRQRPAHQPGASPEDLSARRVRGSEKTWANVDTQGCALGFISAPPSGLEKTWVRVHTQGCALGSIGAPRSGLGKQNAGQRCQAGSPWAMTAHRLRGSEKIRPAWLPRASPWAVSARPVGAPTPRKAGPAWRSRACHWALSGWPFRGMWCGPDPVWQGSCARTL